MPKAPTSAIGLDIGRYSLKSVLIQRKGSDRYLLTHYASHPLTEPLDSAEALGRQLKAVLKQMGGSAKAHGVAVSSPESLIRIIEQPETPPDILRDALRLNGMALLNQDTKEFVLDCDEIPKSQSNLEPDQNGRKRYLVGGLPRTQVSMLQEALEAQVGFVDALQLAPICALNAFEFAYPEVYNTQAFFLVDIGHINSTVMVGVKRELVLVRTIDFGGKALVEALTGLSGEDRDLVFRALDEEDEVMVEYTRVALNALIREIQSSIGFLEHRHEETISKIFVSGGATKSKTLLKVLGEELSLPCESWSAIAKCESTLPANRADALAHDALDLNVACGAATEILKGI
jgi:Tfp pilus assembly PilM family ATPase